MSNIPEVVKRVAPEIESIPGINGPKLIRPKVFPDDRGFFSETYNVEEWSTKLEFKEHFKQVLSSHVSEFYLIFY